MDRFVARANIDHYIELLRVEIVPETRHVLNSLLIAEEDKLARRLEELEFAESRDAEVRDHLNHITKLRDRFPNGSSERDAAQRLLVTMQETLQLMDDTCLRIRMRVNESPLWLAQDW